MKIFLLLGWVELEILLLTVVFWCEMDDEKLMKNEIGSQRVKGIFYCSNR